MMGIHVKCRIPRSMKNNRWKLCSLSYREAPPGILYNDNMTDLIDCKICGISRVGLRSREFSARVSFKTRAPDTSRIASLPIFCESEFSVESDEISQGESTSSRSS